MNFANAALLFGAIACLAPLLIHLLNRSRFQTVDWGAMHLLEEALQVNSRRLQWESWLLLLIRCLIPIILAVCLARPVLTALKIAGASDPQSLVFVLDDSLSMDTANQGEMETPFSKAQSAILNIADQSANFRKSEKTIVTSSGSSTLLNGVTSDNVRLASALRDLAPSAGQSRFDTALLTAAEALKETSHPNKQLILATDFRKSDWAALSEQELAKIAELLSPEAGNADSLGSVRLSLIDVGSQAKANVAVEFATPDDFRLLPGLPKQFRIRVHNFGEEPFEEQLVFAVEGQQVASQSVSLESGESGEISFGCQFPKQGWYTLGAGFAGFDDAIAADNVANLAVQVVPPQQVLLLSQAGPTTEFNPDADFVRLALSPFDTESKAANSLSRNKLSPNQFEVQHLAASRVRPEQFDNGYAFVVLAGVSKLRDATSKALQEFVEQGGGLMIFPGDSIDTNWYQNQLYKTHLLPGEYEDVRSVSTGILSERIEYPPLKFFNSGGGGDLDQIEFKKLQPLKIAKSNSQETSTNATVGLRSQDGNPLIATQSFGQGQVIQFAFSCSDEWTNASLKPMFVPLIQQLAFSISRNETSPNLLAGTSVRFAFDASTTSDQPMQLEYDWQPSTLEAPKDVKKDTVDVDPQDAIFAQTHAPGIYQFHSTEDFQGVRPMQIVTRMHLSESDCRRLTEEEIEKIAETLGAQLIRSADEYRLSNAMSENGREIWRWFLCGLLVLLFAEILLGRAITKGDIG